jgi:hypothetical protein
MGATRLHQEICDEYFADEYDDCRNISETRYLCNGDVGRIRIFGIHCAREAGKRKKCPLAPLKLKLINDNEIERNKQMDKSNYFSNAREFLISRMKYLQGSEMPDRVHIRYLVDIADVMSQIWIRMHCRNEYAHPQYHSAIMELHQTITSPEFYETVWNNKAHDWGLVLQIRNEYRYKEYLDYWGGEHKRLAKCEHFDWYLSGHEEYIANYFVPATISTLKQTNRVCEDNITDIMAFAGFGDMKWNQCLALVYNQN